MSIFNDSVAPRHRAVSTALLFSSVVVFLGPLLFLNGCGGPEVRDCRAELYLTAGQTSRDMNHACFRADVWRGTQRILSEPWFTQTAFLPASRDSKVLQVDVHPNAPRSTWTDGYQIAGDYMLMGDSLDPNAVQKEYKGNFIYVLSVRLAPDHYMLSVSSDGQGTIESDPEVLKCGTRAKDEICAASFKEVTLLPRPADGWKFDHISCGTLEDPSMPMTLTEDTSCTVHFRPGEGLTQLDVGILDPANGDVRVDSTQGSESCRSAQCTYALDTGTQVTLTAIPHSGYQFKEWNCGAGPVSPPKETLSLDLAAHTHCDAAFEPVAGGNVLSVAIVDHTDFLAPFVESATQAVNILCYANTSSEGCTAAVPKPRPVTLRADGGGDDVRYSFHWEGACVSNSDQPSMTTVMVSGETRCSAVFDPAPACVPESITPNIRATDNTGAFRFGFHPDTGEIVYYAYKGELLEFDASASVVPVGHPRYEWSWQFFNPTSSLPQRKPGTDNAVFRWVPDEFSQQAEYIMTAHVYQGGCVDDGYPSVDFSFCVACTAGEATEKLDPKGSGIPLVCLTGSCP